MLASVSLTHKLEEDVDRSQSPGRTYAVDAPSLLSMEAPPQSSSGKHRQQLMRTVSISILVMSLPVLYVSFLHVPPTALFRDTTFWFLMSNSIIIVIAADSGMLFFGSSSSSCSIDVDDSGGSLPFVVVSGGEPTAAAVKDGHALPSAGGSVSSEVVMSPMPVEVVEGQAFAVVEHRDLTAIAENDDDRAYALVVRDDDDQVEQAAPESKAMVLAPSTDDDTGARRPRLTASHSLAREEERTRRRRRSHRPSRSHSHALLPVQDKSVVAEKQLRRTATEERESEYSRLSDEELNRRVEEFIARFNREIRLQVEKEQSN